MTDEQLARAVIARAGTEVSAHPAVVSLLAAHEWAQAGISAMSMGIETGIRFPSDLIIDVLARWTPEMGPVIAHRFASALAGSAA